MSGEVVNAESEAKMEELRKRAQGASPVINKRIDHVNKLERYVTMLSRFIASRCCK